jgi:hypothetical protein
VLLEQKGDLAGAETAYRRADLRNHARTCNSDSRHSPRAL